ncbi:MAG: hypothetical protein ACFB6S_09075 [Geminicoccaceae bacterium]
MERPFTLEGFAIVSADGLMADAEGVMPDALRFEADWRYFQDQLDRCSLCLIGRHTHEAAPNHMLRRRLILSTSVPGWHREDDVTWWWNPVVLTLGEVLDELIVAGDTVSVVGGTRVFDLVASTLGFDRFHLSLADGVRLDRGKPVFSGTDSRDALRRALTEQGLGVQEKRALSPADDLSLEIWARAR